LYGIILGKGKRFPAGFSACRPKIDLSRAADKLVRYYFGEGEGKFVGKNSHFT
jgi:hypothetical protein